jgi:tetratricopeptide (TPR) repeat protein
METSAQSRLIPLLLVAVTLLTFGRVIVNDFAPYDDEQTIYANGRMNPPQFDREGILWYWDNPAMSLYAPLTYTVWGVVASVSRVHPKDDPTGYVLDPANFHIASLLLHVASVLLVFAILRRLLKRPWPAAAGALLYALHPLQVETVAWASGLKDLLAGALSLATIWLYLRAVTPTSAVVEGAESDEPPASRIDLVSYALAIVCFVLALLAKSSAMMTPVLLLVIDGLLLRRGVERTARSVAPFVALAIPAAVIAKLVQPGIGVPEVEVWQRPVVAGASLAFYLQKLFAPIGLAFDYGWRPVIMLQKSWFYAIAVIPFVLGIALWTMRDRWRWAWAAALLFVVPLLPVLGFVPFTYQVHSTVGDHYLYLAMLGPALILAWALARVQAERATGAAVVSGIILLVLAVLSFAQLRFWRDPETTLRRTLAINPTSDLALNNLAQIYTRRKEYPEAERLYKAALDANPELVAAYVNLIRIYQEQRRVEDFLHTFLAFKPINAALPEDKRMAYPPDLLLQLGQAAARHGDFAAASRFFEEASRLTPADPRPREALRLAREKLHPATTRSTTAPSNPH